MRKIKKLTAFTMAFVMAAATISVPAGTVNAEEVTQEYVILAKNDKGYDKAEDVCGDAIIDTADELEDNNILVAEMTEKEAEKLEKDKNIFLVEEDIPFEASTIDDITADLSEEPETEEAEVEKQTESVPEEITESQSEEEATEEETEEVLTEKVTEEPTTAAKKDTKKNQKKDKDKDKNTLKNFKEKKEISKEDLRGKQWNLDAIHAVNGTGRDTIKVAVLDSGVSYDDDIDINERVTINEKNEVDNILFDDTTGHGTAMAGVISAKDNGMGISGINPNAEIYSVQILDENNQTTLSQVIAGIYYAMEQDCNIINMSFGTSVNSDILHEVIRSAYDDGILLIAASGNQEGKAVEYPAAYDEVLAVGAADLEGNKLKATCDGKEIEIFAPGSQVITTGLFGGSLVTEGTSIATAQVSGAASLLWAMDKSRSAGYIRSLLTSTSQKMENSGISNAGLIDIENAVKQYKEFSDIYVEDKTEYVGIGNRETEDYSGIKLVNGSWSGDSHAGMVSNSASGYGIKSQYITLMQTVARQADTTYKSADYLHGSHNYVKGLKFLYQCALYLRNGKGIDDALKAAEKDAKMNSSKYAYDEELIKQTRKLLKTDVRSDVEESSAGARYYKVMGFAIHLVGDVYAHRVIVPAYTVSGTNPGSIKNSTSVTSADAKFGSNDFVAQSSHSVESSETLKKWAKKPYSYSNICKRWKCFEQTVKLGVMEFRDIKYYMRTSSAGKYEDNANFCKERYADAKLNCEFLYGKANYKEKFDGVLILFPTEKHVKLNYFKNYAKNAGEDTSYFSDKEWNTMSTMEEY